MEVLLTCQNINTIILLTLMRMVFFEAKFWIPSLRIYGGGIIVERGFSCWLCSLDYKIEEFNPSDLSTVLESWRKYYI